MCDHSLNATLEEECEPFDLEVVGEVNNSRRITVRPSSTIHVILMDFCSQVMLLIVLYLKCTEASFSILFLFQVGLSYKDVAKVEAWSKHQLEKIHDNVCPNSSLESLDDDTDNIMLRIIHDV